MNPENTSPRAELEERLRFETLLADLSARFVNVPAGEVDHEIMDAQRRLCEFLGIDMSAVRQWSDGAPGSFTLISFYSAQEGPQPPRKLNQEAFPWIVSQMRADRIVAIASLEDLPAEAACDREAARQLGIQSSLCLPLSVGGELVGILGLNTTRAKRDWPEALVKRLKLVVHVLASALARKNADQALRASQERLSLAADAAEAGAWELDCQTQVFWVTDKARALSGYLPGEVVSIARLKASVHPDDWNLVQRTLDRSLQSGEPLNLEYRIRLAYGRERWIASRGRPSFKPTGEPDRLLGLSIDITERKRTEAALRASEARLAVGAELAGLGYHEVDYGKGTCFADDRVQAISGVPAGQHSSLQPLQVWFDHLHPDDRQHVLDERQKMHDGKVEHLSIEYRYVHPTEGQKWIHHLTRVASRDGALRTVGVLRDITERKWAERALIESHERFRRVVEASPSGILLVDEQGRMTLVNAQIERLFGYTREELVGQTVDLLVPDRFRAGHQGHRASFHQAPAPRMMGQGRELFGRRKDGTEFPLEIGLSSVQGPEGILVLAAVVDLSARKQAEAEASRQRAELAHLSRVAMLGELSGSMAHELNQPLTAILSNAQAAQRFLADGRTDVNEVRDILADIVAEDKRAGEVIHRLRLLLKKGELQARPLSVNEVLLEVLKLVRSELVNQNFTAQTRLAPDLPVVYADGVQLQQVLLNLVMNACEAMAGTESRARELTLRTSRSKDGSIHVSVADCGMGIPPEKLEQIFESFYTTKPQGMGLGLAVCRTIITAHGGKLWATNNPAQGATVHFTLPASGKAQSGNDRVASGQDHEQRET